MALSDYKTTSWAKGYREYDKKAVNRPSWKRYSQYLTKITENFGKKITVLDIGCGTGRFFCSLKNVETLYGLDNSETMLNEAKNPVNKHQVENNVKDVKLIHGNLNNLNEIFNHDKQIKFDFIYSIGLLSEYGPTTEISVDFFNSLEALTKLNSVIWLSISKDKHSIIKKLKNSSLSKCENIKFYTITDDKATKTILEIQRK